MWSLEGLEAIAHIKSPKLLPPLGIGFSSNGKFMCLAERRERDGKDQVSIYYAGADFKLTNVFDCSDTFDLVDCKWVMQSTAILVQDAAIDSKFVIYNVMTGRPIAVFSPDANMGLGIRIIKQAPNEKTLACGMFDCQVSLYNNFHQKPICNLNCPERIPEGKGTLIFEEKASRELSHLSSKYENVSLQKNVKIPKLG